MKIKFGALVVDGSGKIGGHVVGKNRGGKYLRTKVTPSNPQTQAQTLQRSLLGGFSQQWSLLNEAQRTSFNSAVNDFIGTDIFGDSRTPSGQNLFVGLNMNTKNGGYPVLVNAPVKEEVSIPVGLGCSINLTDAAMNITLLNDAEAGSVVLVYATPPLSAGRSFAKNRFRLLGHFAIQDSEISQTGSLYNAYVSKFGVPSVGANIQVSFRRVVSSGQVSPNQRVKVEVIG